MSGPTRLSVIYENHDQTHANGVFLPVVVSHRKLCLQHATNILIGCPGIVGICRSLSDLSISRNEIVSNMLNVY